MLQPLVISGGHFSYYRPCFVTNGVSDAQCAKGNCKFEISLFIINDSLKFRCFHSDYLHCSVLETMQ